MNEQKPYAPIHAVPDQQEATSEAVRLEVIQDPLTIFLGDNSQTILDKLTDEMESTTWLCKQVTPLLFEKDQNEFLKQARIAQKALRSVFRNLEKLELQMMTEFPKIGYFQLFILITGYIFGGKITPEKLIQTWSTKTIRKTMASMFDKIYWQRLDQQKNLDSIIFQCKKDLINLRFEEIREQKFPKPSKLQEDLDWVRYVFFVDPGESNLKWNEGMNWDDRKIIVDKFLLLYKKYFEKKPPVEDLRWTEMYQIMLKVQNHLIQLMEDYYSKMDATKKAIRLEVEKEMDID